MEEEEAPACAAAEAVALARALLDYYPLAGCLAVSVVGELQVDCGDGGEWLIEAVVKCARLGTSTTSST